MLQLDERREIKTEKVDTVLASNRSRIHQDNSTKTFHSLEAVKCYGKRPRGQEENPEPLTSADWELYGSLDPHG